MAEHLKTGQKGEKIARSYLQEQSYQILEINWRFQRAEVDIIAMKNDILVFIEVKTRTSNRWGNPEDSISPKKQSFIADAASQYMEQINHQWEVRFDVISIIIHDSHNYRLKHYPDAFFPGW